MKPEIVNYVNRIVFILDESGSMDHLQNDVIKVLDTQIEHLIESSKRLNQETRVSVYTFNDSVKNLIWEKDCLRIPTIRGHYHPRGCTALIDATLQAIEDYEKTPQLYGDYATVIFVLSDGICNINEHLAGKLKSKITSLPDNWTVVFLAPDALGVVEAKRYGFPAQNIQVWSTDGAGLNEVGRNIRESTEKFMVSRAKGVRGTKSFFTLDAAKINRSAIQKNLDELPANKYEVIPVRKDASIRDYVESYTKNPYVIGSGYYQLTKKETIQANKNICVRSKQNGKVYTGLSARELLGLPDHEIRVEPSFSQYYDIYVQSNSTNRRLIKGTDLIVLK